MIFFATDGAPRLRLEEDGDRSDGSFLIDPFILRNRRAILNDRCPLRSVPGGAYSG